MGKIVKIIGSFFLDIIETVVIALSVFLIVYLFFMQPHQVKGQSMVPTFEDKEYLLTDKISYRRRAPLRGEIVVFKAPEEAGCPTGACDFIKRVMGVPGDQVRIDGGVVHVNGQAVDEPYLSPGVFTQSGKYLREGTTVTLGPDEYFVMGDNRNHSSDSRAWGPIDSGAIVGRVFFRYWPPDKTGVVENSAAGTF